MHSRDRRLREIGYSMWCGLHLGVCIYNYTYIIWSQRIDYTLVPQRLDHCNSITVWHCKWLRHLYWGNTCMTLHISFWRKTYSGWMCRQDSVSSIRDGISFNATPQQNIINIVIYDAQYSTENLQRKVTRPDGGLDTEVNILSLISLCSCLCTKLRHLLHWTQVC